MLDFERRTLDDKTTKRLQTFFPIQYPALLSIVFYIYPWCFIQFYTV